MSKHIIEVKPRTRLLLNDLEKKIIRTPVSPDITFSDDPLRQLRAVRFAAKLGFFIDDNTLEGIQRNADRLSIISEERISTEFLKILASPNPAYGIELLHLTGLFLIGGVFYLHPCKVFELLPQLL